MGDYRLHVWNLRRPNVPSYVLDHHESLVTGALWADENVIWSIGRDQRLIQQDLSDPALTRPVNAILIKLLLGVLMTAL